MEIRIKISKTVFAVGAAALLLMGMAVAVPYVVGVGYSDAQKTAPLPTPTPMVTMSMAAGPLPGSDYCATNWYANAYWPNITTNLREHIREECPHLEWPGY